MTEITDNTARHATHILPFVLASFAPLIPRLATLHLGQGNGVNALSAVQNGSLFGALPWIILGLPLAVLWACIFNVTYHVTAALIR